ncbi:MAG: Ldh family oxidoreductase [Ruminococcaceae bacterium]|nr:Ldh family oxidoreductase [Oscillospiraceae bacterium]
MKSITYSAAELEAFCRDAFIKFGFSREDAAQITDVLLLADLYGIRSHGTQRLVRYHKAIENGSVRVDAKPETVFETPVSAVIDGHAGMGQLISAHAMKLAIQKAKAVGMAFVTVKNSNHYGIAGYYAKMACDAGMMGICVTNSESIMVHTGSRQAILGSNPIAFAMPADPIPFWFDAATTVVPKGKLEVYNKAEKPLGDGWAVDETGRVCTDAGKVLHCIDGKLGAGGILPVGGFGETNGGHKGYGYSMICELLSSITSGGATSNHHVRAKGQGAGTCHAFIAIDPAIFGDPAEIRAHLSTFLQELRDADRADEATPIYSHGEKEMLAMEKHLREGIEVDISTVAEMVNICKYLGMDSERYLGKVDTTGAKASIYEGIYK